MKEKLIKKNGDLDEKLVAKMAADISNEFLKLFKKRIAEEHKKYGEREVHPLVAFYCASLCKITFQAVENGMDAQIKKGIEKNLGVVH